MPTYWMPPSEIPYWTLEIPDEMNGEIRDREQLRALVEAKLDKKLNEFRMNVGPEGLESDLEQFERIYLAEAEIADQHLPPPEEVKARDLLPHLFPEIESEIKGKDGKPLEYPLKANLSAESYRDHNEDSWSAAEILGELIPYESNSGTSWGGWAGR